MQCTSNGSESNLEGGLVRGGRSIVYDKQGPEPMHALFELLREKIDVPARQIVIEALVIELLSDRARDLGVSFTTTQNQYGFEFAQTDALTGNVLPFIFTFDKDRQNIATFRARLSALFETGEAELLSNPSVLVLDGRQARIQIANRFRSLPPPPRSPPPPVRWSTSRLASCSICVPESWRTELRSPCRPRPS